MLHSLCYLSSANTNLTDKSLEDLFQLSKANNSKQGITGVLLYQNGNFLQICEGEKKKIDKLYDKIQIDNRHKDIILITNSEIKQPMFEDYETGFTVVNNSDKMHKLETYLDWLRQAEIRSVDKVVGIVENFIKRKV